MTSYQDQPLSRREIREREAAARAAEAGSTTAAPAPADAAAGEPLDYATRGRAPIPPYDAPLSQPGVSPVTADDGTAAFRYRDYSPEASAPARHGVALAAPADLDYRTLNRPDASVPLQPAPAPAPAPTQLVSAPPSAAPAVESVPEATMSRREMRAFREAQERAAEQPAASAPPMMPAAAVSAPPAPAYPSAQPAPSWPVVPPTASVPPATAVPPAASVSPAYAPPTPGSTPPSAPAVPAPPPLVEPAAPSADASADLEALFRAQTAGVLLPPEAASAAPAPVASAPAPAPIVPPVEPQWAAAPPQAEPSAPQAPPVSQAPELRAFTAGLQPPSPFDPVSAPPAAAPAVPQGPQQPWPEQPASASQPPVAGERPRNHWSRQAELDDEAQPPTGSLARDVGARPTTSNALVMPVSPTPDIIVSPLTGAGEVLVTGSISLPASLASTGALPAQLDESDLDNLLDPNDHQVSSTDSQPVRAIRAVSTHTSSREIIGATRPKRGSRALTALIVSAVGMAVVVVALLVVALTSGVLG